MLIPVTLALFALSGVMSGRGQRCILQKIHHKRSLSTEVSEMLGGVISRIDTIAGLAGSDKCSQKCCLTRGCNIALFDTKTLHNNRRHSSCFLIHCEPVEKCVWVETPTVTGTLIYKRIMPYHSYSIQSRMKRDITDSNSSLPDNGTTGSTPNKSKGSTKTPSDISDFGDVESQDASSPKPADTKTQTAGSTNSSNKVDSPGQSKNRSQSTPTDDTTGGQGQLGHEGTESIESTKATSHVGDTGEVESEDSSSPKPADTKTQTAGSTNSSDKVVSSRQSTPTTDTAGNQGQLGDKEATTVANVEEHESSPLADGASSSPSIYGSASPSNEDMGGKGHVEYTSLSNDSSATPEKAVSSGVTATNSTMFSSPATTMKNVTTTANTAETTASSTSLPTASLAKGNSPATSIVNSTNTGWSQTTKPMAGNSAASGNGTVTSPSASTGASIGGQLVTTSFTNQSVILPTVPGATEKTASESTGKLNVTTTGSEKATLSIIAGKTGISTTKGMETSNFSPITGQIPSMKAETTTPIMNTAPKQNVSANETFVKSTEQSSAATAMSTSSSSSTTTTSTTSTTTTSTTSITTTTSTTSTTTASTTKLTTAPSKTHKTTKKTLITTARPLETTRKTEEATGRTTTSPQKTKPPANTTEGDLKPEDENFAKHFATNGSLVAALSFGCIFLFGVMLLLGKRFYDSYQRRHYSKVDYLINGMYN